MILTAAEKERASSCMNTTKDKRVVTTTKEFIALNQIKSNETTGY